MSDRVVVIAPSQLVGRLRAKALGIEPVAIVTPRSPAAARGLMADSILVLGSIAEKHTTHLMQEVVPCLAASTANAATAIHPRR